MDTTKDGPLSESLGHVHIDGGKWILTHAIWHPMTLHGHGNCPETGIHYYAEDGKKVCFDLIQHGWRDWGRVERIISRCLKRGRDAGQIARLIERVKSADALLRARSKE